MTEQAQELIIVAILLSMIIGWTLVGIFDLPGKIKAKRWDDGVFLSPSEADDLEGFEIKGDMELTPEQIKAYKDALENRRST